MKDSMKGALPSKTKPRLIRKEGRYPYCGKNPRFNLPRRFFLSASMIKNSCRVEKVTLIFAAFLAGAREAVFLGSWALGSRNTFAATKSRFGI